MQRCTWCEGIDIYEAYHDTEWGVPTHDDRYLFECLCLEGQQAGLSWITVLRKREEYRKVFFKFDLKKVAAMDDAQVEALLQNPGVIRHHGKLTAIRDNARAALVLKKEFGSLAAYFWATVGDAPLVRKAADTPENTAAKALGLKLSKDLKKRGFRFVGETTVYAFMQAVGMVNDHHPQCFRYAELMRK